MQNEKRVANPSNSAIYRVKIKNMIEMVKFGTGGITEKQKSACKYFALPLTEDFSKRRDTARPEVETNAAPTDSVKY